MVAGVRFFPTGASSAGDFGVAVFSFLIVLTSIASSSATAASLDAEHFSAGLPVEVDLVGLAFGLHPELLWRPFDPEGAFHLRAATGVMVGPELTLVPVSLGFREVFLPTRTVRPGLGFGLQLQNFFPYGHEHILRLDQYMEITVDVRVRDDMRVGLELSPEFGWLGGFGLGMATRVGVQVDLPLH